MADKKVNIHVTADTKDAEKKFNGIQDIFKGLSKGMNDFASNIKSKFLEIAGGAAAAFQTIKGGWDLTKEASQFNSAVKSMKEQFGVNADVIISKLKEVSKGTLANKDIVIAANRAMALNVTKDVNVMAQLLEFARIRAKALGTDTTSAFNDIVTGIGRNSPMILDNLGIITKGWDAEAAATGKAYDSQFVLNKVLEQATVAMSNASAEMPSMVDRMAEFAANVSDAKIKLGDELSPVFEALTPILNSFVAGVSALPQNIKLMGFAFFAAVPAAIALNAALGPIGLVLAGVSLAAVGATVAFGKWKQQTMMMNGELKILSENQLRAERALNSISLEAMEAQGINAAAALKKVKDELKLLSNELALYQIGSKIDLSGGTVAKIKEEIELRKKAIAELEKQMAAVKKTEDTSTKSSEKIKENAKTIYNDQEKYTKQYEDLVTNNERSTLQARIDGLNALLSSEYTTAEKRIQIEKEVAKAKEDIDAELNEKRVQYAQNIIGTIQGLEQGVAEIIRGISANTTAEIQNDYIKRMNALQDQLDKGIISEEEYATQKKAIDKDIALKKAQEERKLAEVQKGLRIAEIIMNTASAIMSAFVPYIPILSEARAIIAGTMGAVQLGVAAAAPLPEIPAFASGVRGFSGGTALVGEQGPELVNLPSGSDVIPNNVAFPSFPMADAISAAAVSGSSFASVNNNQNQSRSSVLNFYGNIVTNSPADFFAQMQQYQRENNGIA